MYPERLRFDFNNNGPVSIDDLHKVEQICTDKLSKELEVSAAEVPLSQAQKIKGLRAVFGEVFFNQYLKFISAFGLVLSRSSSSDFSGKAC